MSLRILLSVFILILTLAVNSLAQIENMRIVAKVTDKAPDQSTITTLNQPSINNKSEVAFLATDSSTPKLLVARNVFGNPKTEIVIDRSTSIVGLNGAKVFRAIFPKINDNGDILFAGSISNLPIDGGLFLFSKGEVKAVALAGKTTPLGGVFGTDLPLSNSFSLNNRGDIVFLTNTVDLMANTATPTIFLVKDNVISKVIMNNEVLPDIGKIVFNQNTVPTINEKAEVLFSASTEDNTLGSGIYLASNGTIKKVVVPGDRNAQGEIFEQVSSPGRYLNNKGEILFQGRAFGKDAIYLFSPETSTITKLIGISDPSPDGGVFTSLAISLTPAHGRLTEKGSFVFRSTTSKTPYGLFYYSAGKILKIVGHKDPTPLGGTFSEQSIFNAAFLGSIISDNDEVVFEALISGGSSPKALIAWSSQVSTPKVISVVYDKKAKLLKINASNINDNTRVEINGKIVSQPIKIINSTEISITGKRKELNLNKKVNSNKLILISESGVRSIEFTF